MGAATRANLVNDAHDFAAFTARHSRRLLRVAACIVRDDAEAEDALQQALLNAYTHLDQFAGRASLATWMTRITTHEALARRRRRLREAPADTPPNGTDCEMLPTPDPDPETLAISGSLCGLLEATVAKLPDIYRSVIVLRALEGLSTEVTARRLTVSEDVVKTRLSRARLMLREALADGPIALRPRGRRQGAVRPAGASR
jgi:RNA polymerase sigma-70 factor (ECF subfamily)